tara:strand:- start:295 stop:543 length:249 start_codon:yes stop_codon:yes gene_type:complete
MIEELEKLEALLDEAIIKRLERYSRVKDMRVSAMETEGIMRGIAILNKEIKKLQTKVNDQKKMMNYHDDEIKRTQKMGRTRI